jgi:hypothetical protein
MGKNKGLPGVSGNATGISDSLSFSPSGICYRMNVIIATITKITTSHFAISMVKPAIPFHAHDKENQCKYKENYRKID